MFKSPILPIITLLLFTSALNAQKQKFIILRHAEKDTTVAGSQMMQADPPLNAKGQDRAQSLIQEFKIVLYLGLLRLKGDLLASFESQLL